jgi:hypothetical protein
MSTPGQPCPALNTSNQLNTGAIVVFAAHLLTLKRVQASRSRRMILHSLAGGAGTALTLAALGEDVTARKRRKRKRRKKSSRKRKPSVRSDAFCPGPETNGFFLLPQGMLAQSFTAGQTGLLVRATLLLGHFEEASATGNLFLRLAPLVDAFPGAADLATAQVPASSVAFGTSEITFTFTEPAQVKAGTSYALVLSRDGTGSISWSNRSDDPCDGRSFFAALNTAPLEPINNLDYIFTTFVQS